ncbi:hypothetical protein CHS0354_027496 [Potamilus streckersoni]|uniref:Uncharacterized protein n=1 Tax=Potamilus streckersoni TaxID=2493646 RepID=A0AAE0S4K2_9BIVA|nr:hypothetical protein CHS0354_027496 [Potamilus streckersoni]
MATSETIECLRGGIDKPLYEDLDTTKRKIEEICEEFGVTTKGIWDYTSIVITEGLIFDRGRTMAQPGTLFEVCTAITQRSDAEIR